MATLSNTRANRYLAAGLIDALGFNGNVEIHAFVVDVADSKFNANITLHTNDVATPTKTFTPCDDNGEVKKFSTLDDVLLFVNGAINDVESVNITFENVDLLAKPYKLPTDIVAESLRLKNRFTKLLADLQDNKTKVQTTVAAMAAQGYNGVNANPAQVAAYNAAVAKRDAVLAIETWYTNRIAFYTAP